MVRFVAAALGALALAGCSQAEDTVVAAPTEAASAKAFELTPAVIAMRWQWLNPEINSFTFRDTDKVFESRPVVRGVAPWELPRGQALAMPANYAEFAERTFTNAMLVIRDGKIVFEDYRNRSDETTRFISFSMAKTITSLLTGIAIGEGKLKLDDPVMKYVPELKGTGYDGVTVRQVLQMRSGVDYQERYDFGDNPSFAGRLHEQAIVLNRMRFAAGALETRRGNAPGSTFNYSTLDTMLLGWVLENATGQKLEDYTRDKLWGPLGAEADGFWLADGPPGNGRALNGMGYNAVLRDFGRIGQLMLQNGKHGETQVVPADWIRAMITMMPTGTPAGQGFPGYGFQTWQIDGEPGAYAAVGLAGQFIYVHPASRTVIVKLSYYPPVEPAYVTPDTLAFFKAVTSTK